jgi:U3 small nucleolar RNA-associated protein 14
VDSLLKAAKMKEDDICHTEDTILKMNHLSVEEIAQRRSELRKMRELMFRAEIKARRINKIKSKTYRRLRRKEKARLGERIDENDDVEVEEGRLKSEIERAKERATLRHKNTGKWAKKMKGRDDLDEDTRKDLEDMLARGEKLRKRIQGVGSDESQEESDEDDGDEEVDLEEGIAKVKQDAFDELTKLDEQEEVGGDGQKGKSVFEMKFMKDAMARQAAATNKEVDDFIKEMGGSHALSGEDETANVKENDSSGGVIAMRAGGRVVYRPGAVSDEVLVSMRVLMML